jgi:hypothetical protein
VWQKLLAVPGGSVTTHAFAVGPDGSMALAVSYTGTADFGGGPFTSTGTTSLGVARFDGAGNHLWSNSFGGAGSSFTLGGLSVNAVGTVLVTSGYAGAVDLGAGVLPAGDDTLVAAFDPCGNLLWDKGVLVGSNHTLVAAAGSCGAFVATDSPTVDLGAGPLATSTTVALGALGLGGCANGSCTKASATPCAHDADCGAGKFCDPGAGGGTCAATKPIGATCGSDDQCASGFCVDGVCCASACDEPCYACTFLLTGAAPDGTCAAVPSGAQDPTQQCAAEQAASSCAPTGLCGGGGACQCVTATCSDGLKDGTETDVDCGGSCPPCVNGKDCKAAADCESAFCNSLVCAACSSASQCASGDLCDLQLNGGTCLVAGALGAPCTAAGQCTSGFCADGVCCNAACNGVCNVCDAPGMPGVCNVEPAGGSNPNHPCSNKWVCDGSDPNGCVDCVTTADCTAQGGFCGFMPPFQPCVCDTATNQCVECLQNSDCASDLCDVAIHTCYQCTTDANCAGAAGGHACDTTLHACVQCTAQNHSACVGSTPVCDTMNDADGTYCVQCNVDADCPSPATQACSSVTIHTCLLRSGQPCSANGQCASNACAGGACH